MNTLTPVALALVIVLALAAIGGVAALLRHVAKYRSFQDLAVDAQDIAKALHGEVFRDGDDLVISGNQGRWPVVVRCSHSETMPGLDIHMEAPASFTLWVAPKSAAAHDGRAGLRTGNEMFDARFSVRSDHPTQAGLLLGNREVVPAIQRLCSPPNTALAMTSGAIEVSEQGIPRPYTAKHVLDQLVAMQRLADAVNTMPGAERFKIRPIRKERHIIGRVAIAIGVLVAVLTVVAASNRPPEQRPQDAALTIPEGMSPLDAVAIGETRGYRLAAGDDFDGAAIAWLRSNGITASGRVTGDFLGSGTRRDAAYLLVDKEGNRRLVLLAGGATRFDVKLTSPMFIARVPKGIINSIRWVGRSPHADGDGLLVVRRSEDLNSGLVLFVTETRIVSAVPANYQSINLQ